ncbi:MAG: hypothetical protein JWO69_2049 [Thermoleophilia bacterium]|nr:hypothetical protein [Thermoleophilia bacterium]
MSAPDRRLCGERFVYRLFDATGALLYIGRSGNVAARVVQHGKKPWGPRIASVTTEGPYLGTIAAEAAESVAIEAERPPFAMSRQQASQRGSDAAVALRAARKARLAAVAA